MIADRTQFDRLLDDAIVRVSAIVDAAPPGDLPLESILAQLRVLHELTARGASVDLETKRKLTMGLQASRWLSGVDPELANVVTQLESFVSLRLHPPRTLEMA